MALVPDNGHRGYSYFVIAWVSERLPAILSFINKLSLLHFLISLLFLNDFVFFRMHDSFIRIDKLAKMARTFKAIACTLVSRKRLKKAYVKN